MTTRHQRFIGAALFLAVLAGGCRKHLAPVPWHQPVPVGAVAPGQFHTIPFGYNPSVSGWPGAVGDIVQNAGSTSAWVRSGTADTAWVVFPQTSIDGGSGGGIAQDGGVLTPLAGVGTVANPLSIPAATPDAGGYLSATDKAKLNTISPSLDYFVALSGAATSITLTGLNGNADGGYWIDFCGQTAAVSAAGWQFEPNGVTTNLNAFSSDGKVGGSSRTDWFFANTGLYGFGSGALFCAQGHMTARTGRLRQFQVEGFTNDSNKESLKIVGQWGDTTTNLTSLSVVSNQANGLTNTGTTGTYLRLTPDNSSN